MSCSAAEFYLMVMNNSYVTEVNVSGFAKTIDLCVYSEVAVQYNSKDLA